VSFDNDVKVIRKLKNMPKYSGLWSTIVKFKILVHFVKGKMDVSMDRFIIFVMVILETDLGEANIGLKSHH
jgi:hypothetical protein